MTTIPQTGAKVIALSGQASAVPGCDKGFFWLPWFPRDFAASTLGWPLIARGIYRELLDAAWEMQGLPESPKDLREIVRASPQEWAKSWPLIEPKFPVGVDRRRRNPKLEQHRKQAIRTRAARRAGAAITNAKKRGGHGQ